LDKNNIARYIYVPHQDFPQITKIYFKEVLVSYFGVEEDLFENVWGV
jgi:hypothetical protein